MDTGCPVPLPDAYIYYVSDMINVWDTVSISMHLPWMILSPDILLEQRIG